MSSGASSLESPKNRSQLSGGVKAGPAWASESPGLGGLVSQRHLRKAPPQEARPWEPQLISEVPPREECPGILHLEFRSPGSGSGQPGYGQRQCSEKPRDASAQVPRAMARGLESKSHRTVP